MRALQCKNNLILAKLLQLVCLPLKIKNQLEDIASYAYDKSMIPSVNQVEYQSYQHEDDCRLLNHKTSRSKTLHQVELLLSEHLYSVLQLVFLFQRSDMVAVLNDATCCSKSGVHKTIQAITAIYGNSIHTPELIPWSTGVVYTMYRGLWRII